jgi:hypothetical protein
LQPSYETPHKNLKEIYKKYGRAQLEAMKQFYLTPQQIEQVENEGYRIAGIWERKYGRDKAKQMWKMRGGDEQMFRVILKDFLVNGKIKTDNGAPIPKEKLGISDVESIIFEIDGYITQYSNALDTALRDFKDGMKEIAERDLTLKNAPTLQSSIEEVFSDLKDSLGTTILNVALLGLDFIPIGTPATLVLKGAAALLGSTLGKMEEQGKLTIAQQKEEMTIIFKDKIEEFTSKLKQNIENARVDIIVEKNKILNSLINAFKSAKGPHQQRIKYGVIFSLRSLNIQAIDLRTKDIDYFKSLLCAAWINSVYDTRPDDTLIPPVITFVEKEKKYPIPNRIQPGHLKIEFAYYIGNWAEVGIESQLPSKKGGKPVAWHVGTEIRALGARKLRVMLNNIIDMPQSKWYLQPVFKLPVPKTIYFSLYNPKNAGKEGVHNYIRLDKRNNIVDFHYQDWHLAQFVEKMLHPIVVNFIKKTGGFKGYMETRPDIKIRINPYWEKYFGRITFPE